MTVNLTPTPVGGPIPAGPKGDDGLYPMGQWAFGLYRKDAIVSKGFCQWRALRETSEEPGFAAVDWGLFLDGRGLEQGTNAAEAALVAQYAAETARDEAIAIKRGMLQQRLGAFANDAAAEAFATAQSPPLTIVTGTYYLNTTTDIFRYAIVSSGPSIAWHDVTEDEAAQAALATTSAAAAATSASAAATSASAASASASAASTSATAAGTQASAAGTSATSAASQASAAGTSASNAASSAAAASTSAATATTKASESASSATAAAASAAAAAASAAILTYRGFVNRLRNADLRINQRGVSGTVTLAAGAYGHDGWKAGADGCTYTFAQSGMDVTITISAGSLLQPIESGLIEGGYYRLSHQGTAQARVWQGSTPPVGGYAAAPFTTANLTAVTRTNVEFSTGTVLLPQLERGTSETAFERRPNWAELAFCQRYYLRRASAGTIDIICMVSAYNGADVWGKLFDLPVEMRADGGTVGFSSAGHLAVFNASGGASYAGSSVSGGLASKRSVAFWGGLSCSGSPGFTAGQALFLIFNNAAGWIDVSVEI